MDQCDDLLVIYQGTSDYNHQQDQPHRNIQILLAHLKAEGKPEP